MDTPRKPAPRSQENRFVFVGQPALTGVGGSGIRSKLIREAQRRTQAQRQENGMAEINKLLKQRAAARCSCRRTTVPETPSQFLTGGQPEGPADLARCSFCRHIPRSRDSLFANERVHDLGCTVLDPMLPINEKTSRLKLNERFSFACRHIFPKLRSLDLPDLYRTWAFPFDNDELKLFSFLWSSKYHEGVLRQISGVPEDSVGLKEQLTLKGLTLKALRKEVASYTRQKPLDSIIGCILVFAVNGTTSERLYRDPNPFTPTFTRLHGLEAYGSRDYDPLHWNILCELLEKNGGIEGLHYGALAWQVSVADLTNAVHTLRKPFFPIMNFYGQKLELPSPLALFAPYVHGDICNDAKSQKAGSGFSELLFIEPPVHEMLVTAFSHVGELSYVITCMSTQSDPQLLDLLASSRNLVHHRLFSLPTEDDPPDQILQIDTQSTGGTTERSMELYLICRLGVLLYATHVTFPSPRPTVARGQMLRSLYPRLLSIVGRGFSSPLILWCTSLALIAFDGTEYSGQISLLFKELCRNLHVTSLEKLLGILRSFTWVDLAVMHHYTNIEAYIGGNL
ncbi:uncharacterized protein N7496_009028 [Penicillium cataractarum]|uniref:Uncharacterized protein n=1 Tax=Penicillium cataractarum TaxID=2100454 RepID=A0A9W9S461_9EURO|nr:uncharacterized protein N7496_009028 [Penicillium cataractarum]KAJ5369268.1 hypothetical protein N7496_009028 [Penicillium cataractarum]